MAEPAALQFFTPSWAGDLDRFVLLRQTVNRFARCPVQHVVAVPRRDVDRPDPRRAAAQSSWSRLLSPLTRQLDRRDAR